MRSLVLPAALVLGGLWSVAAVATSPIDSPPAAGLAPPSTAEAAPKLPSAWKSWGRGWVRIETDGNLSCLSDDGKSCLWQGEVTEPATYDASRLKPVVCGAAHQEQWPGLNGYNDNDNDPTRGDRHWCRSAYATHFATWTNYSMLGVGKWLAETPAGDVMCHSTDGKTCSPATLGEKAPPASPEIHPLVCGAHYRRVFKEESYDAPGHWCRTPKIDADFGERIAMADFWGRVVGNGWSSQIEPALLLRVDLPEGRSLTVETMAELKDISGANGRRIRYAGFEFGKRVGFHVVGVDRVAKDLIWRTPRASHGPIMAAMTMTKDGNACVFVAPDLGPRETPFFARETFIGSTRDIVDDRGEPLRFVGSPDFAFNDWGTSPTDWRADAGEDFVIKQVVALYDRYVPDEKRPGHKRFITYAERCDKEDALTADW